MSLQLEEEVSNIPAASCPQNEPLSYIYVCCKGSDRRDDIMLLTASPGCIAYNGCLAKSKDRQHDLSEDTRGARSMSASRTCIITITHNEVHAGHVMSWQSALSIPLKSVDTMIFTVT